MSAIVVSNHGARQMDGVVSPLDVLPDISAVVAKKIPVIVDGGFQSGEDIFKALAMGATAVMIGRPILWSLGVGGEKQLVSTFNQLTQELILTMRLSGCASLKKINEYGLSLLSSEALFLKKILQELENLSEKPEEILPLQKTISLFSK